MRLAVALLLALAPLPAAAQNIDHAALARRALDAHIRPGYARLAETAQALATTTADLREGMTAFREKRDTNFTGT